MKKIFTVFLIMTFICSTAFCVAAYETEPAVGEYSDFLSMLGIEAEFTDSQAVTRAEFAHILTMAMNYPEAPIQEGVFTDVYADTKYASSVFKAYQMGIVSGNRSMFRPLDAITANEAVKMAVYALGYIDIAQSYGGYPVGYYRVADEIGMTDGLSIYARLSLTADEVQMLIYNFLCSGIYIPDTVSDNGITYLKNSGETPLSVYFNLEYVQGVVKTAGHTTMLPSTECDEATFYINGYSFKTDIPDSEKYLGMNVGAWYDRDSRKIKAVYVEASNTVHRIYADEITASENNRLTVYDEDSKKEKTFVLNPSFTFVKNGRPMIHQNSDFFIGEGELRLIDNDGDNRADVVLAMVCEYMTVLSVDNENGIIYTDSNTAATVNAKCEDEYFCRITDASGRELHLSSLKADTAISVYRSIDGKYAEIIASTTKLNGVVEEKGDGYIIVNSEKYKYNSHFTESGSVNAGVTYTFLLAHDNSVSSLSANTRDTMKYGYVLDFASKTSGLESQVLLSILTQNSENIYPALAENVILDGISMKFDDPRIKDAFVTDQDIFKYQVIRYSLDNEAKINKIDTAIVHPRDEAPEVALTGADFGDNKLSRFLTAHNTRWYSWYNIFSPNTLLRSDTVIFSVPYSLCEYPEQEYNPKDFAAITTAGIESYGPYKIDTYDVNELLQPGVVVVYNPNAGSSAQVPDDASLCLIESVRDSITKDGEKTKSIIYYADGAYNKRIIAPDIYPVIQAEADSLKSGDLIRIAANSRGEIIGIKATASFSSADKKPVFVSNSLMNRRYDTAYYVGKSFYHSDSALTLLVDEDSNYNADGTYPIVSGVAAFSIDSVVTVAAYDSKTETVTPSTLGAISDVLSVGEDNAPFIVIKCYSHRIQQIFIYK